MKVFLRHIFVNLITLYTTTLVYPGFLIDPQIKTILTASIIWLLLNKIVKPIIKLLLLPINLITLNLFSWLINVLTLFLLQMFADGIKIIPYQFQGISEGGFALPSLYISHFFSYLLAAFLLNTIHTFIIWLIRKDIDS